jgi:DNA polymerase bacteriophage-type
MPVLHLDIETRSAINLERVSTWRYAVDETTEVLCAAYAIDHGPIGLWTPGAPIPGPFNEIAIDPEWRLAAHNTNFEFSILQYLLAPRFDWPSIPIDRFICTMAMARASALPGSLDGAADALGLAAAKDKAGAKLMKEIATRKREPTPEDLERLHAYCRQDVEVERELFHRLPQLTEKEQALWVLDQHINQRGIPIDRELAVAIAALAKNQRSAINAEIAALTCGKVTTANQRDKIIKYLCANGCEINSLTKADVKAALVNDVGDDVRKLLELRAVGGQAAASKVGTLLNGLDSDGRLRETLVYHGAATGRWTGRRFQPQNLKKPNKTLDVDAAIAAIKSGELARVEALGAPLSIAADVSRGLIAARPGYVLIGADFSAIESRVLAWLADEKWKLASYRQFDETNNPAAEPYCLTATKILKRTVTPADEEGRAVGKVADLAGGFGGGVGAWRRFAPQDTRDDATIKADITAWRKAHPRIVRFWSDLENALKRAIRRPGKRFQCGRLSAECHHESTLFMTLPSGRRIGYPQARLVKGKFEDSVDIAFKDNEHGKWTDVTEWYGTFIENAVSGTARDLLAAALMRLEAAGFPIVGHVHDEAIAEIPEGTDQHEAFLKVMTTAPEWADGLPIAGKPWCGQRYLKSEKAAKPEVEEIAVGEQAVEEIPTQTIESETVREQEPPWEGMRSYATQKADAGKPYGPVRARLIERGYRLAKSFSFVLPGDTEPLFYEDRYEKAARDGKKAKECRFRHVVDGH